MKPLFPPEDKAITIDKEHGRIEKRTLLSLTLSPRQVSFPFANQIFSIHREFTKYDGTPISSETIYGITSLNKKDARPYRLLALNRGHWCIESNHYIRDVTMREDKSRIRKGNGPRAMAILRNLTITILKKAGKIKIAESLRKFAFDKNALFLFMGLFQTTN